MCPQVIVRSEKTRSVQIGSIASEQADFERCSKKRANCCRIFKIKHLRAQRLLASPPYVNYVDALESGDRKFIAANVLRFAEGETPMESLLILGGRAAGLAGILLCIVGVAARLLGHYHLAGFSTGAVLQAGTSAVVIACFLLLLARVDRR